MEGGLQRCDSCGLASPLEQHFRSGLCPACSTRGSSWLGALLPLALGGSVAVVFQTGGPVHLLLFAPALILGVILHEAVHSVAALAVGWRPLVIRLGGGTRSVLRFRVGGVLVDVGFGLLGISGYCLCARPDGRARRRDVALLVAAPMAMHAAFGSLLLIVPAGLPALFALVNLFMLVEAAVPSGHAPFGVQNDGRLLLELWRRPREAIEAWRRTAVVAPSLALELEDRREEALDAAKRAAETLPDDAIVRSVVAEAALAASQPEVAMERLDDWIAGAEEHHRALGLDAAQLAARGLFVGRDLETYLRGNVLLAMDRLDEVVESSRERAAAAAVEEVRALWHGRLALALLLRGHDPYALSQAEHALSFAYPRLPWVHFILAACGMLHVERGQDAAARAAFTSLAYLDGTATETLRSTWTAVADARRGRRRTARGVLEALGKARAWPACIRRLEEALAATSGPTRG